MKKQITQILTCASLILSSCLVHANFTMNASTFNTSPALGVVWLDTVGTMSYDANFLPVNVTGGSLPGSTVVKADFLFGTSAGSLTESSPVFTLDQFGTANGGAFTVTSSINGGTAGFYQMRAWVGGNTFNDVANTRSGVSAVTAISSFGGGTGNSPVPDLNLHANFAVTATVVPEPATIALGLFGAAGLLIRRRQ